MKHSLHRTVQRHTYGLIYRLLQHKYFNPKWSKKAYLEILIKAVVTLIFVWFAYFYYTFSDSYHFDVTINTDPKVCHKSRYLRSFENVKAEKLDQQISYYQMLLNYTNDVPVTTTRLLLPMTQAMLKGKTPICPKIPPHFVGFLNINNDTTTLDQDLLQLKKKLKDLRVTATKLRTPYESTDKSTLHDITSQDMTDSVAKELKLPDLAPHLETISFVYPVNRSSVPLPLYIEQPPIGVVSPGTCFPHRRTAIIIPYRNREEHLKLFIRHMHKVLSKQQIEYGIYVINLAGDVLFNRAKLLNIGYKEALYHYSRYDCVIFHDVDLLPEDDRNLYTCEDEPKHMSVAINTFNYRLPYRQIFGGVSAMTPYQFELVNGYSNLYWGWGGEDDDMFFRLAERCMTIYRISGQIARYRMARHHVDKGNEAHIERYNLLSGARNRLHFDGLSSLKYKVLSRDYQVLYNNITVEIGTPEYFLQTRKEMREHYVVILICLLLIYFLILRKGKT